MGLTCIKVQVAGKEWARKISSEGACVRHLPEVASCEISSPGGGNSCGVDVALDSCENLREQTREIMLSNDRNIHHPILFQDHSLHPPEQGSL